MKYALVNGEKCEPIKGVTALCPNCGSKMIAKCGSIKIDHWSHKVIRKCDPWWENETAWHRDWKNNFPLEWQEIIMYDAFKNEKHIADVRTKGELVIEFQHSFLSSNERIERENFYQNMVWVVDGTRLINDFIRFSKGFASDFIKTSREGIYKIRFFEDYFPKSWIDSKVPVIFDFKGNGLIDSNDIRNYLYCLVPTKSCRNAKLAKFTKMAFLKSIYLEEWPKKIQNFSHAEL